MKEKPGKFFLISDRTDGTWATIRSGFNRVAISFPHPGVIFSAPHCDGAAVRVTQLMHRQTAARLTETSDQRMKLMQLGLQVLVHQQEGLKGAPHVALACLDDFLDSDLGTFGTHLRYPANY